MKNLSNIEHELDIVTKQYVDNAADTKVDKIEGKQLSTNDFTTEEKEKLAGLSITQYSTLPTANIKAYKDIVQYVGNTTEEYTTGYFYQCLKADVGYEWVAIDVQDIDWSRLSNYSTNLVSARALTDDIEEGIYTVKVNSLPVAHTIGGMPLDIIHDTEDANIILNQNAWNLFAKEIVSSANMSSTNRQKLFTGSYFYITYNGIKRKITLPVLDSTPVIGQVNGLIQNAIREAFGTDIVTVSKSGMNKIAFLIPNFSNYSDWTEGCPTVIFESGDDVETDALTLLNMTSGSILGFNINLPLNQLLDESIFVDGQYSLNVGHNIEGTSTVYSHIKTLTFLPVPFGRTTVPLTCWSA